MKFIIGFTVFLLGNFSVACPNLTGEYGGWCIEENSCYGKIDRYYGYGIFQKSCEEMEITYIAVTGSPIIKTSYTTVPVEIVGEYWNVVQFMESNLDNITVHEKFGNTVIIKTLKIVKDAGLDVLDISLAGNSPKCTTSLKCQIPRK